ncbi:uncharacterized protein LOC144142216 [Haemaphysalis longicornis]
MHRMYPKAYLTDQCKVCQREPADHRHILWDCITYPEEARSRTICRGFRQLRRATTKTNNFEPSSRSTGARKAGARAEQRCVVGCMPTSCPPGTTFHSFSTRPCFVGQREQWIKAVRRKNDDGTDSEPTKHSRICSAHFVRGAPSKDVSSPSYAPTILPEQYRKRSSLPGVKSERYDRTRPPEMPVSDIVPYMSHSPLGGDKVPHDELSPQLREVAEDSEADNPKGAEVSTQTPWASEVQHDGVLTISCTMWTSSCEASTQVAFLDHDRPSMVDASVTALCLEDHAPKGFKSNALLKRP